jgi:thioredoxin reductase
VVAEESSLLDRPRLGPTLESLDVPGVFLAGDITGVPLIKTAIAQGVRAAEAAHKKLGKSRRSDEELDVCVIGAGPAGISALLRLKELGLRAAAVDQGSVAQSIQNFPRGKLVFDQPLELPVLGKLWLKESTKEELLLHWTRIVRKEQLDIRERTRMMAVRPVGSGFSVETREAGPELGAPGAGQDGRTLTLRARTVILAIGQRGTPRKLTAAIPEELQSSVHYHLADARSLAGKRVIIVGIGDVAMESALALSAQARTQVTIVARAATYSRGQSRNIAELERQRKAGRISVLWQSEVETLAAERGHGLLTVRSAGAATRLPFDSLFVLIGTIPPWDTLQALGITRAQAEPARSVFLGDEKTLRSET